MDRRSIDSKHSRRRRNRARGSNGVSYALIGERSHSVCPVASEVREIIEAVVERQYGCASGIHEQPVNRGVELSNVVWPGSALQRAHERRINDRSYRVSTIGSSTFHEPLDQDWDIGTTVS